MRSQYAPWISENTKIKIKERNDAQKRASQTKNKDDWDSYKRLRNNLNNTLKVEKINWQRQKKIQSSGDIRTTWKNIKQFIGWSSGGPPTKLLEKGQLYQKPSELARTKGLSSRRSPKNNQKIEKNKVMRLRQHRFLCNKTCKRRIFTSHNTYSQPINQSENLSIQMEMFKGDTIA